MQDNIGIFTNIIGTQNMLPWITFIHKLVQEVQLLKSNGCSLLIFWKKKKIFFKLMYVNFSFSFLTFFHKSSTSGLTYKSKHEVTGKY